MGAQGDALAARLQAATDALIAAVQGCPEEKWKATTSAEGWTVAATAYHIANGIEGTCGLVAAIGNSAPLPPLTMDMLNAGNAASAKENAAVAKTAVLDLARKNVGAATGLLRGLSDEQLGRSTPMALFGNQTMSAAQIADMVVVGHVQEHAQSLQATV